MKLSPFGKKFTSHSGILSLMDDLGNALAGNDNMIMMGGGNPAHIPQVEAAFKERLQRILDNPAEFTRLVGTYDPPQGEKDFLQELACFLNRHYHWGISERNIALTNGSQAAFFMLFNMFAGQYGQDWNKRIQLPLAPEYIGYADSGLTEDFFLANKPDIEHIDQHTFKYHVDFQSLTVDERTGALCASRPTNPTGNVLTDQEIEQLDQLAARHDIPLIIDNAYGAPFPNLIYSQARLPWNEHTILCLSLSKLGLPATRTGIVVASEEVIAALSGINAIMNLAPNSFGSLLALDMIKDDSILSLCQNVIRPYYQDKSRFVIQCLKKYMTDIPWKIHKPEGSMFLWLWFKDLPVTSLKLYEVLKACGVLVVSGHYFFPGMADSDWRHRHECIRITFTRDYPLLERGVQIIANEVRKLYSQ